MRHWLLILMIALLPLRGWVSDAMAVEMSGAQPHAWVAEAADADHPCPEHSATATADHDNHGSGGDHTHTACDVCNGPALALAAAPAQTLPPAHSVMVLPVEHFASTEAQRGVKPPIS